MTRVYINGQLVAKEELSKYEIRSETVKQIFREALRRKQRDEEDEDHCFLISEDSKESFDV